MPKKKKFLGQYTFHFFAYYMIDVILTSNKAVLPLFLFLTSPVVHFLSRLPKKVYSWFFYNKNEYDSANDI